MDPASSITLARKDNVAAEAIKVAYAMQDEQDEQPMPLDSPEQAPQQPFQNHSPVHASPPVVGLSHSIASSAPAQMLTSRGGVRVVMGGSGRNSPIVQSDLPLSGRGSPAFVSSPVMASEPLHHAGPPTSSGNTEFPLQTVSEHPIGLDTQHSAFAPIQQQGSSFAPTHGLGLGAGETVQPSAMDTATPTEPPSSPPKFGRFDCKVPGCGKKYNSSGGIRYHLRHVTHEGMPQTEESFAQLREAREKDEASRRRQLQANARKNRRRKGANSPSNGFTSPYTTRNNAPKYVSPPTEDSRDLPPPLQEMSPQSFATTRPMSAPFVPYSHSFQPVQTLPPNSSAFQPESMDRTPDPSFGVNWPMATPTTLVYPEPQMGGARNVSQAPRSVNRVLFQRNQTQFSSLAAEVESPVRPASANSYFMSGVPSLSLFDDDPLWSLLEPVMKTDSPPVETIDDCLSNAVLPERENLFEPASFGDLDISLFDSEPGPLS